jgi:hypothetical protein
LVISLGIENGQGRCIYGGSGIFICICVGVDRRGDSILGKTSSWYVLYRVTLQPRQFTGKKSEMESPTGRFAHSLHCKMAEELLQTGYLKMENTLTDNIYHTNNKYRNLSDFLST